MKLLENKVAIITGGSGGIGKAIAHRFASEGAAVVVSSRNRDNCELVKNDILAKGNIAKAISCDIDCEEAVASLFKSAHQYFGHIDIVVNSAGISGGKKAIEDYSLDEWSRVLHTNLTGAFLVGRESFKYMKENGGHILFLSSQAGVEGYSTKGSYCASKFGVRGFAHALGEEGRKFNINVTAICPGTVDTPILAASDTRVNHPMIPDAIADATLYLACLKGNSLVRDLVVERRLTD